MLRQAWILILTPALITGLSLAVELPETPDTPDTEIPWGEGRPASPDSFQSRVPGSGNDPSVFTHGPRLGDLGSQSVTVWARISREGVPYVVEFVEYDDEFPGTEVQSAPVSAASDNIGLVTLTGLTPNTRYRYVVRLDADQLGPFDFTTLPGATTSPHGQPGDQVPRPVNLFFSSDLHLDPVDVDEWFRREETRNVSNTFLSVLDVRNLEPDIPAMFFSYGDQFNDNALTEEDARKGMRDLLANEYVFEDGVRVENPYWTMARSIPSYNVWDDHDFMGNNRTADTSLLEYSRETRKEIWTDYNVLPDLAPDNGGGLAFHKRIGDALVVVLDFRYANEGSLGTRPAQPSYWDSVGLGTEQIDWLLSVVADNSDAAFLIVLCSTTTVDNVKVSDTGPARRDSFGLYHQAERNQLYEFIDDNTAIRRVLLITGDDHFTKIHQRSWVHSEKFDPTDPSVDYSALKRHYFQNISWYEFKMNMGPCSGEEPPFEHYGLGDEFGPPEVLAYDWSNTFLQMKLTRSGNTPNLHAMVWARNTHGPDHQAGSQDWTVTKIWERVFVGPNQGSEEPSSPSQDPERR